MHPKLVVNKAEGMLFGTRVSGAAGIAILFKELYGFYAVLIHPGAAVRVPRGAPGFAQQVGRLLPELGSRQRRERHPAGSN